MIDSVIIIPDWVSRAMYQVIANCTIEEPNSDTVWLDRKRAVFFLQFLLCSPRFLLPPSGIYCIYLKINANTGQVYYTKRS